MRKSADEGQSQADFRTRLPQAGKGPDWKLNPGLIMLPTALHV
jgi:hypothetical protein